MDTFRGSPSALALSPASPSRLRGSPTGSRVKSPTHCTRSELLTQRQAEELLGDMARLSLEYHRRVKEEERHSPEEVEVMNVGKVDPKRHLEAHVQDLLAASIVQCLGTMIDTVVF